ncbi:MAG: hypothetical protein KDE26_29485, partial [Bacteroidetes bacterium]|nr:hypothetical protein [Bacteroidota bacterium]
MSINRSFLFWIFIFNITLGISQSDPKNDYNVTFYDLEVQLAPDLKRIAGKNHIWFYSQERMDSIHFDIKKPLQVARVIFNGKKLGFTQTNDQVKIGLPYRLTKGTRASIEILFAGDLRGRSEWRPVWSKDYLNKDLIAITSEEVSPESWWPVKNYLGDMPDSMHLSVIYPDDSKVISSIPHQKISTLPGNYTKWEFHFSFPIFPHQVGFHVGDFVSVKDVYTNESGNHPIEIFSARSQKNNSQEKIQKIKTYFAFLEKYYGPYPFWGNGFQWFELPSHPVSGQNNSVNQVSISQDEEDQGLYRQLFLNWFGRTIKPAGPKDQWIFEALLTYNEALYMENQGNEGLANKYLLTLKTRMGAPVLYMDSNLDNPKLKEQVGIKG